MSYPYSPEQVAEWLRQPEAKPWPDISERAAWAQVVSTPLGQQALAACTQRSREFAASPPVPPSFTQALDYKRNGNRSNYESRLTPLAQRLSASVLAALLTGEAEFIDHAADAVWAVGEISNWVGSAHRGYETDDSPGYDLAAAMRGQEIAEALQLLGPAFDTLSIRLRQKVKRDLHERVFTPFLTRDYWFTYPQEGHSFNNWTAVCSGCALNAALSALDDEPEVQAEVVARAVWSLNFFLSTFGEAGSLDEGVGYWSYGFSHYVMAAERLYARTRGAIDLLADPLWQDVASFPLKVNLYGNRFVNFSDCPPNMGVSPGWIQWLGSHLELPEVQDWAARRYVEIAEHRAGWPLLPLTLRELLWQPQDLVATPAKRALSTYLPDVHWFLTRSNSSDDALILAAKGGHNAENHNHNDGGSFIVHYAQEAFVEELGAPTYTRQFFEKDRYENIAARSMGHSVPFVNGYEQVAGREYAGQVLPHTEDVFALDMSGYYPREAGIKTLTRTLSMDRSENGRIRLVDEASFSTEFTSFAVPLMTLDKRIELEAPGRAVIHGHSSALVVQWNPECFTGRTDVVETDDLRFLDASGASRIARLWIEAVPQGKEVRLEVEFSPKA